MGVNLADLTDDIKRGILIENLYNKTLAIDAFNIIYQFITIIKGRDGKPLKNVSGDITSHLSGLVYRNLKFMEHAIKPIYCFDGLDKCEKIRHKNMKENNKRVRINKNIINSSKELLDLMGIPYIQAPGEGEAQCVYLCKNDDAWATVSQDYDVLLYGGLRLVRNLNSNDNIEYISLEKLNNEKDLSIEKLIDISILIGNDYISGIKGVGIKTAYSYIDEMENIDYMIDELLIDNTIHLKNNNIITEKEFLDKTNYIRNLFLNPNIDKNYKIKRTKPDFDELYNFLMFRNDFSGGRVGNIIKKLRDLTSNKRQTTLVEW